MIRKMAETIDPTIEFSTKSHYGGPELIYVISKHKESLQELTGSKTLTPKHVKALKALGFVFKQQTVPEKIL
jgi:hypothetical protein